MKKNIRNRAGSEKQYGPRLAGGILHDYLNNSNEPLAVAFREHATDDAHQGWHPNTEFGVDLKTLLCNDRTMVPGKEYHGILRLDQEAEVDEYRCHDAHCTFKETAPLWEGKRNPRIFNGRFITMTQQHDGQTRLNFKRLEMGADFSVEKYALGVYNEICMALEGLVEK